MNTERMFNLMRATLSYEETSYTCANKKEAYFWVCDTFDLFPQEMLDLALCLGWAPEMAAHMVDEYIVRRDRLDRMADLDLDEEDPEDLYGPQWDRYRGE